MCNLAHVGCTGRIPERLQLSTYGSISGSRLMSTCAFSFRIQGDAQGTCASAAVRGREGGMMLYYALVFLLVALVAGFLGLEASPSRQRALPRYSFLYS